MPLGWSHRSGEPRREHPSLTTFRLGLTVAGLILFGYGIHVDVEWLRWAGIGLFAIVVALRFWPHRTPSHRDDDV